MIRRALLTSIFVVTFLGCSTIRGWFTSPQTIANLRAVLVTLEGAAAVCENAAPLFGQPAIGQICTQVDSDLLTAIAALDKTGDVSAAQVAEKKAAAILTKPEIVDIIHKTAKAAAR